jgi:hypothetical protein
MNRDFPRSLEQLYEQGLTAGAYYDYENERDMWLQADGRKLILASFGSTIYFCPVCGEEHFRDGADYGDDGLGWETCFNGHGVMKVLRPENVDQANSAWLEHHPEGRIIPAIERRRERIRYAHLIWADDGGAQP